MKERKEKRDNGKERRREKEREREVKERALVDRYEAPAGVRPAPPPFLLLSHGERGIEQVWSKEREKIEREK